MIGKINMTMVWIIIFIILMLVFLFVFNTIQLFSIVSSGTASSGFSAGGTI